MSPTDDRDEQAKKDLERWQDEAKEAKRRAQEQERVSRHAGDLLDRRNVEAARRVEGLPPSDPDVARTPERGELEARREAVLARIQASRALPAREHYFAALSTIDLTSPMVEAQLRDLRLQIQDAGVLEAGPLLFRPPGDFDTSDIQHGIRHLETLCALRRPAG